MVFASFTWIFVCSVFLAVFVAYGIGANDVANAFGSSVGAKALTMKQAILVASIFEFAGAVLLGAGVTDTIRGKIADLKAFTNTPELYMYGMLCAMLATGIWILLATYFELPVSTTHSITGAVIGMSMVAAGADSVMWSQKKDTFPFLSGVSVIVISWFTSPLLSGIAGAGLFLFTRHAVLRRKESYKLSLWMLPLFTFATAYIGCFFVIQKGVNNKLKGDNKSEVSDGMNAWISAIVAAVGALIAQFIGVPLIKRQVERDLDELNKADVVPELEAAGKPASDESGSDADKEEPNNNTPAMLRDLRKSKLFGAASKAFSKSINYDVHAVIKEDEQVHDIHANSEVFDKKTELSFKYLQVFTACCNSFAHGSNDVANAIGPFAGIYAAWQCTCVSSKSEVPIWILVVGGSGLVLGLATYGYKIMRVLGVKMTKLTNSRGFCVELAASLVIIIGSRYGLPLSTTHCMVGAVTGIGIVETFTGRRPENAHSNKKGSFNWFLLGKFFLGWVATLVVAALTSAAFTAQGIYAPYRNDSYARVADTRSLNRTANYISRNMSALAKASNSGLTPEQQVLWSSSALDISYACNATTVPVPPTSFNYITGCMNVVMDALTSTTYGGGANVTAKMPNI